MSLSSRLYEHARTVAHFFARSGHHVARRRIRRMRNALSLQASSSPGHSSRHFPPAPALESLEPRLLLSAVTDAPPEARAALELFNLSSALFVENQGQWDDSIRYLHQGNGANVAMTDSGPVFQVFRPAAAAEQTDGEVDAPFDPPGSRRDPQPMEMRQFSVSFVGAGGAEGVEGAGGGPVGLQQARTTFNYQVGEEADWRSEVPAYEVVAYEQLYAGIDLHTFGQRSNLKYEFLVAPGGDYSQIQITYDGIEGLSIAADGSLMIDLGGDWQPLTDAAPYVYQEIDGERIEIQSRYVLVDEWTYTFELGEYDAGHALVIDPELAWSTYLGGAGEDIGYGIAVDGSGNVLVTGYTFSSGWVSGGYDTTLNGTTDAFVVKLSADGEHLWSTYLGGTDYDLGTGIAVDGSGNVLVTGYTYSSGWVSGGYDTTHNGNSDTFVVKLSAAGEHLWSTYLGGTGYDWGYGIAVDGSGNVLVTGSTGSHGWVSGGYDATLDGAGDAFAVKLSGAGQHLWSTYLGGTDYDSGSGIAVDGSGNVLVTGYTYSSGWVSGGHDTTHNGTTDAFVVKLSAAGQHLWSTYLGGTHDDYGRGIAVDGLGNALVTGYTGSSGWVSGGYDTTLDDNFDAFVVKLSADGEHLWSTYLGGTSNDIGYGIAVDGSDNVLVTGETWSSGWVSGGHDTTHSGGNDAFVVKLGSAGGHLWSTYLGGTSNDYGYGIAADGLGNALVTGSTWSSGWALGGYDTTYSGGNDAFVVKLSAGGGVGNVDPNDQLIEAIALGAMTQVRSVAGVISPGTDVDMYSFTVTAGQRVEFDIDTPTNGSPGLGSYLRLFNSSGTELAANNDAAAPDEPTVGFDSYIEYTFATAGTYYIGVSNWGNINYNPITGTGDVDPGILATTGSYSLILTTLANNAPVTDLSGTAASERMFRINVPPRVGNLKFEMSGGSGDADLYVKFGSPPTTDSYDHRPYLSGNNEMVTPSSATAGTWHVMIRGYSSYSGVTLTASYETRTPVFVGNDAAKSVTYTDADGTIVTVTVKNGRGTLGFAGDNVAFTETKKGVTVTGANLAVAWFLVEHAANATVAVTTKGGDKRVTFGELAIDGSVASIKMAGVDIEGNVEVTGLAKTVALGSIFGNRTVSFGGLPSDKPGKVTLGRLTDVWMSSGAPIQLTVASWTDSDPNVNPDSFTAPYATTITAKGDKKLNIAGHWAADVYLTGEGAAKDTLKTFKAQSLSDSMFFIFGSIGTFDVSKGTVGDLNLTADANIKTVKLGDVTDSLLRGYNLGAVQAARWLGGEITADTIKSLKVAGDKKNGKPGDLNVDLMIGGDPAAKASLNSAAIAGLLSGQWTITGPVGAITAGNVSQFTGNVAGAVKAFNSKTAFSGLFAAFSFARIDIKTHLTDAKLIAGGASASFINALKIGGNATNASIRVGVQSMNGIFGDGDDILIGGTSNLIKTLTIGGATNINTPMFFAGLLPKTASINKIKTDPLLDPRFAITPV